MPSWEKKISFKQPYCESLRALECLYLRTWINGQDCKRIGEPTHGVAGWVSSQAKLFKQSRGKGTHLVAMKACDVTAREAARPWGEKTPMDGGRNASKSPQI